MQYVFGIIIFLFGSALGSFLAVIANRYNTGLPFFKGRSICFACNTQLQKKDLIPIFSFLFLRGRCRHCSAKIPTETILIEITMGALSVLAAFKSGILANDFQFSIFNFQSIFQFSIITTIFAVILLISIYDLKHFIIPDSFLIFLFVFAFLHTSYFMIHNSFSFFSLLLHIASGLILTLPFFLLFLLSRGTWFGFGDVKYIAVIGFFLGLVSGLSAVVLAFWIGAAFSLVLILAKKLLPKINLPLFHNNLTIKSEIPFGPFLSLGTILSLYLNLDLFNLKIFLNVL